MNANEIKNKIEEVKNDEAIYANKDVLNDMAAFAWRLNDLIAFKELLEERYVERGNDFLTFAEAGSTKALIAAMKIMMGTIADEDCIEERLISVGRGLETFRECLEEEYAQYEKMKSYFENKE